MLIFSNYSKSHISLQNVNKSIFFQLYKDENQKQIYYKSTNLIRGFYKDTILNDFFYFSSNGLNTAIIRKKWINKQIFQPKSNSFVSYFYSLEDKFLRFNIYPRKYFRKSLKKYLILNQKLAVRSKNHLRWKIINKNSLVPLSKELKPINLKFLKTLKVLQNLKNKFNSFSMLNIKTSRKRYYFINTKGIIKCNFKKAFKSSLYLDLIKILNEKTKRLFNTIIKLEYLLFTFYSNILLKRDNPKKLLLNLILYYSFFKYKHKSFLLALKKRKIGLRLSNISLYQYYTSHVKKTKKLFNMFFKLIYYNLKKENFVQSWIRDYLYAPSLYNLKIKSLDEINFLNQINKYSLEQKLSILKFLIYKYQLILNNKFIDFFETNAKPLHEYLILKSKLLFHFVSQQFSLKNFFYTNFYSNINDLFLNKTINIYKSGNSFFNIKNIFIKSFYLKLFAKKNINKVQAYIIKNKTNNIPFFLDQKISISFNKLKWYFKNLNIKEFINFLEIIKPNLYKIVKQKKYKNYYKNTLTKKLRLKKNIYLKLKKFKIKRIKRKNLKMRFLSLYNTTYKRKKKFKLKNNLKSRSRLYRQLRIIRASLLLSKLKKLDLNISDYYTSIKKYILILNSLEKKKIKKRTLTARFYKKRVKTKMWKICKKKVAAKFLKTFRNRLMSSRFRRLDINFKRFKKQTRRGFTGKFLDWKWKNPLEVNKSKFYEYKKKPKKFSFSLIKRKTNASIKYEAFKLYDAKLKKFKKIRKKN